ncbi:MAG: crossover junction endodeoxyribonuclease RuvC [Spirochaetales bacterium]|nr:crossover junction endodeoxyribonuclease RuvC [Spirochaetales bacterium]
MSTVLGIDPGIAATGFGVITVEAGRFRCVEYGVIRTRSDRTPGDRLREIYDAVLERVGTHNPDLAGIESLYFTKNVTSAIPVAQARGVVLLALAQAAVPTCEYTPQAIKQAVVGSGQADKEQVIQMVRIILGMPDAPRPDHAADALATAITRFNGKDAPRVQ